MAEGAAGQRTKPSCDPLFEATFRSGYPKAVRVAARILGDRARAEEIAAEACTRAFVHWKRLSREPWREAWLVRVAANLAIDTARRRAVPLAVSEPAPPDDDLVVLRSALVAALARLPRRQRDVVVLRYLTDLSEADTACALGISEGTVKTHLSRGLAGLRQVLGPSVEEDLNVTAP